MLGRIFESKFKLSFSVQFNAPEGIKDHREEDKLSQERNHQRGGWNDFSEKEEEHGERK